MAQPPLLPSWPTENTLHKGAERADLAQGWATMSERGVPYLFVQGFGAFNAGGSSQQLVLRFVIPPVVVDGHSESAARALWRARMRVELLLNGYPAWASAAARFNHAPLINGSGVVEQLLLEHFGSPLDFTTNDDDASTTNDSAGSITQASAKRTVYLNLGRFQPGSSVELAMVLRGTALTQPRDGDATSHRCAGASPGACKCSRATVRAG